MAILIDPAKLEYKHDHSALEQFDLLTLSPRLTNLVGSKHFVFDIRKLEPGKYSFPYHFHHNAEELVLILSGSMTIRTPDKFFVVTQGELVFFEMGETGAHQFYNHTTSVCSYLDLRTTVGPDICEYPDSGKVNIVSLGQIYEKNTRVDYNKGEENVEQVWKNISDNQNKKDR